ncbi:hypothetical protein NP233_g1796 [Leucocoprinus birnbaumii]|uniref:MYND-type domain-containing protein n=1 Tax=Leucocoprinus birnbaumii TaxID=56174 RepID=A0AAD5W2H2_9AGAR|nr:hypothetical protein NP233_g1796 [Leucocoprinus birnbaumii]
MTSQDIPPFPLPNVDQQAWRESFERMKKGCESVPSADPTKLYRAFEKMSAGDIDFDEMPLPTGNGRVISVPLQILDKCHVCYKTANLRVCNSCASVIYCSRDCQKFDWRFHKKLCCESSLAQNPSKRSFRLAKTQQINLKSFFPFIAYMFDTLRRMAPTQEQDSAPIPYPFLDSVFQNLGRRLGRGLEFVLHPALTHRILKAPTPGARKATSSESNVHHTVVLGDKWDLRIKGIPDYKPLSTWWKGHTAMAGMEMFLRIVRESNTFEVTIATSLVLLSELYSTYMSKSVDESGNTTWEPRERFRLEYGQSPVSDFGICRGRIEGKANRVQTWTYYQPKTNSRTTILNPDNHYWLYFRTIKGEELILDCCTFPFGMEGCVDASPCLQQLASMFRDYGSARTPAYFYAPNRPEECPNSHSLIEVARFSVMHNKQLYGALGWELFGGRDPEQHAIVKAFMTKVQGEPCTIEQEDRVRDYRCYGAILLGQVLTGKHWKEWPKPTFHSRDDCFDPRDPKGSVFTKGSTEDPTCNAKLNGMLGLFSDVYGIN